MRKTPMLPSDEAPGNRRKKGKYRRRTDVPIGKPVKGPTRRRGRAGTVSVLSIKTEQKFPRPTAKRLTRWSR
jgi:hypothetical protein